MKKTLLTFICLIMAIGLFSRANKEVALQKAREAIELMDLGKYEESIEILEECKKIDPEE
ncbi:MAG: hypothetical protein R2795_02675 [Saprospiraceae bacterium]